MSADKYTKHLRSKYKRWVMTTPDGKRFQADKRSEVLKMVSDHLAEQDNTKSVAIVSPKYDPDTGERIN